MKLNFLNADPDNFIPFLPNGVTSIEIMAEDQNFKPGIIMPGNMVLGGAEETYVSYPDGNRKKFLIIWGGGDKKGPSLSEPNKRIFLQLINLEDTKENTIITFKSGLWEQKVVLSRPDVDNPVKMVRKSGSLQEVTFEGFNLPLYYSRWFPPKPKKDEKLDFVNLKYPLFKIVYKKNNYGIVFKDDDGNKWPIRILLGDKATEIVAIRGDLKYSDLHAELFSLIPEKQVFVLRVWLYWIHTKFEDDGFYGLSEEEVDPYDEYLGSVKKSAIEVPDIERIDFIIDAKRNIVILVGTDFHYQEYWVKVDAPFVNAQIADIKDIFLVSLSKAMKIKLLSMQDSGYYNPIDSIKASIIQQIEEKEKAEKEVEKEKEEQRKKTSKVLNEEIETLKVEPIGKKDSEEFLSAILNHVPNVIGGSTKKWMISSDCRERIPE